MFDSWSAWWNHPVTAWVLLIVFVVALILLLSSYDKEDYYD